MFLQFKDPVARIKLYNLSPELPPDDGGGGGGGGGSPIGGGGSGGGSSVVSVSVPGTSMPWSTVTNPTLDYGIHDGTAPIIISLANFPAGTSITLTGSGQVKPSDSRPYGDPNGNSTFIPTGGNKGSTGTFFPTKYMPGSQLGLAGLCGAFTDNAGNVIGTPLSIGTSLQVTVPVGATLLSFGTNDDHFSDNVGGFVVSLVSNTPVQSPTPGSNPLLFASSGGLTGVPSSFQLLMPVFDRLTQRYVVIAPEEDFNCEEDAIYEFPQEEVDPGKTLTVRSVRIKLRNLGIVKFTVILSGMYNQIQKIYQFGDPSQIIPGTSLKVQGLADGKIYTMYASVEFSDEQVQLSIFRAGGDGPLSLVKLMLLGPDVGEADK